MRWPWVSREVCDTQSAMIDRLLDANTAERHRCAELTTQLLAMKREGFDPAPPVPPTPTPKAPLPQKVTQAVAQRSNPNTPLRRDLEISAQALIEAGEDVDAVMKKVLEGEDVEP